MKMTACPLSIVPLGIIRHSSRNQIMDIKITLCKDHGDAATVIQRAWRTYKYRENVVESMIVIQDRKVLNMINVLLVTQCLLWAAHQALYISTGKQINARNSLMGISVWITVFSMVRSLRIQQRNMNITKEGTVWRSLKLNFFITYVGSVGIDFFNLEISSFIAHLFAYPVMYFILAVFGRFFSKTIIKIFQNTSDRDNIPKTIKEYADESSGKLLAAAPVVVLLSVHNAINAFSKPHTVSELCEYGVCMTVVASSIQTKVCR